MSPIRFNGRLYCPCRLVETAGDQERPKPSIVAAQALGENSAVLTNEKRKWRYTDAVSVEYSTAIIGQTRLREAEFVP